MIETSNENFKLRFACEEDISLILEFIKKLAKYEKLLDEVYATEEVLLESLFRKKAAEVLIGEYKGKAIGFALFFHNFSTFVGKPGLYLEDLFIDPEMRGRGFGTIIFKYLAKIARDRNCGRFEWSCLDWNKSSIKFYKNLGAEPLSEWTVYRLSGYRLDKLADKWHK